MKNCRSRGQQVFLVENQKKLGLLTVKLSDFFGSLFLIIILAPVLLVIFLLVWFKNDDLIGMGKSLFSDWLLKVYRITPKLRFSKYIFLKVKSQ